jgi:hypothetical protein
MSKRNKLRYQSKGNVFPTITLTGKIFLRHRDEEILSSREKGDLLVFLNTDILLGNKNIGDYEAMGLEGYLKADVFDGKSWRPLSLEELFPAREYYFGKRERPIDTFMFCLPTLEAAAGTILMRTYREHYVKAAEGAAPTAEEE